MNPLILSPLFEFGKSIIDRLVPDASAKAAAELEINAKEAASPSIFVAGWRPFTGWICSFGLLYATVIHNLLEWLSTIRGWALPPAVDTDTLLYVLGSLLGIGALRTVEKVKNVASK